MLITKCIVHTLWDTHHTQNVSTYAKKQMKLTTFIFLFSLISAISTGQIMNLDSCGIDLNPVLNSYEILYLDSVFFKPYELKSGELQSFTNGFDFENKRIAFFDCGEFSNNGYLSKKMFFKRIIPEYHGPHGLTVLKENEKTETGFDAIITINCKMINESQLIEKLKENKK